MNSEFVSNQKSCKKGDEKKKLYMGMSSRNDGTLRNDLQLIETPTFRNVL